MIYGLVFFGIVAVAITATILLGNRALREGWYRRIGFNSN